MIKLQHSYAPPIFDNHLECLQEETIEDFITSDSSNNEEGDEEVEDDILSKL